MVQSLQTIVMFIFNIPLLEEYGWRLVLGVGMTLKVVLVSCGIGFVLGYVVCLARMSKNILLSSLSLGYITFFRGTPLLCQLYIIYYGAGEIRPQLQDIGLWTFFRDAYFCCIVGFTMNTSAYQAEIFRGAISSVARGQTEAANALGLTRLQTARLVVLPQALLIALRPLGNEVIGIIKASALAAVVTLLDLMGQTRVIFAKTFDFSVYLYAAIIYLIMTEAIRRVWNVIERRLSRHIVSREEVATPSAGQPAKAWQSVAAKTEAHAEV
jgi:polar amino acid transport system permease protein